jgi:hypothetical protein
MRGFSPSNGTLYPSNNPVSWEDPASLIVTEPYRILSDTAHSKEGVRYFQGSIPRLSNIITGITKTPICNRLPTIPVYFLL